MTLQQIFELLSDFFHLGKSVSNGAFGTALSTGLIPILQFAWKWWQERSFQTGKAKLREQIVDLDRFLSAVRDMNVPDQNRLRSEAERERSEAVLKLLAMGPAQPAAEPTGIRRWLLIYAPKGIASLVLHIVFYVTFAAGLLVTVILASMAVLNHELVDPLIMAGGVWAILALILREEAATVDRLGIVNRLERWLLFCRPANPAGWITRVLFHILLAMNLILILITGLYFRSAIHDPEFLLGISALLPPCLFVRFLGALLERMRPPNRLERWLLLYSPRSGWGWILRSLFYVTTILFLFMVVVTIIDWREADSDSILAILIFAMLAAVCKMITVLLERNRPPNRLERWLLLYKPVTRAGWVAHVFFYWGLIFLLSDAITLSDEISGHAVDMFGTLLTGLWATAALTLARISARDFDPSRAGVPHLSRFRSFLLFYAPSRRAVWILHGLFYCLLASLLELPAIVWTEHQDRFSDLLVFAFMLLTAIAIREIAARLQKGSNRVSSINETLVPQP